jgi:glycosyltransferase involved in cell wall biosynthesis
VRVVYVLKTNDGAMWILPQVEELRRRGHDVVVVLPPGPGHLTGRLIERGFTVAESPFNFRFRPDPRTLVGLARLRRLLRRLRPDVVKYHMYPSALAARLSTLGLPVRRVHMVVSPLFLESAVVRRVERHLQALDELIICGTEHMSRQYAALGCQATRRSVVTCGIDTERITVVEPGQPPHGTGPDRAEIRAKARAEIGIDEDAFLVVMVAFVYPPRRLAYPGRSHKGHDVLLAAWRAFQPAHPRARLLLVGGGLTDRGIAHRRDLVARFRVAADPSVTWLDTTTDVRPYYRAADLSVSPSLSEGHGAAADASAMELPSIVSDAGGLPEVIDRDSGWVVARDDPAALAEGLAAAHREFEAGRLARRGAHARRRMVELFDCRPAAVTVADLIERVAAPCGER